MKKVVFCILLLILVFVAGYWFALYWHISPIDTSLSVVSGDVAHSLDSDLSGIDTLSEEEMSQAIFDQLKQREQIGEETGFINKNDQGQFLQENEGDEEERSAQIFGKTTQ